MDGNHLFTEYFMVRMAVNIVTMIILMQAVYFPTYHKRDFNFTFILLNTIVFLLSYMLEMTKAFNSLGSAFGLLAAFSLLRFRTETISNKDMTYLFIVMTVGLINAVMKGSLLEISAINGIILLAAFIMDGNRLIKNQRYKTIEIESLEHIKPEQHRQLIEDLKLQTGLDIRKIVIEHIDLVRKRVMIKAYYYGE